MSNKRRVVSRREILDADDLTREWCPAPEWSGEEDTDDEPGFFVQTMPGDERDQFEIEQAEITAKEQAKPEDERNPYGFLQNLRARLVAATACDEDGTRIFTLGDAQKLGRKSSRVLDRAYEIARKLNGISKEDEAELAGKSEGSAPTETGSTSQPS